MNYRTFYNTLADAYRSMVRGLNDRVMLCKASGNKAEMQDMYSALASIASGRSALFREHENSLDYLEVSDNFGAGRRWLRDDTTEVFARYPDEYEAFLREYDSYAAAPVGDPEDACRKLSIFAELMIGMRQEFDSWYVKSPKNPREQRECHIRTTAIWELVCTMREIARSAAIKWDIAMYRTDFIFEAMAAPVLALSTDTSRILAEIGPDHSAREEEWKAAHIILEGPLNAVHKLLFNTHRMGRASTKYMLPWCEEALQLNPPALAKFISAYDSAPSESARANLGFYVGIMSAMNLFISEKQSKPSPDSTLTLSTWSSLLPKFNTAAKNMGVELVYD